MTYIAPGGVLNSTH